MARQFPTVVRFQRRRAALHCQSARNLPDAILQTKQAPCYLRVARRGFPASGRFLPEAGPILCGGAMKAKKRNGQWSYRHGQYTYPFHDEASRRLAEASAKHGTPPLDPELYGPILVGDVLHAVGLTSKTRYPLCDATRNLWLQTREAAIKQETRFLVRQHQQYHADEQPSRLSISEPSRGTTPAPEKQDPGGRGESNVLQAS